MVAGLFSISSAFSQQNFSQNEPTVKWVEEKLQLVLDGETDSFSVLKFHIIDLENLKKISVKIFDQGKLVFANGDVAYFFTHSEHADTVIGDITVLILQTGECFVNTGHVCGRAGIFYKSATQTPQSAKVFIEEFLSEADDQKWEKWRRQ
jgi:hypothetical protein